MTPEVRLVGSVFDEAIASVCEMDVTEQRTDNQFQSINLAKESSDLWRRLKLFQLKNRPDVDVHKHTRTFLNTCVSLDTGSRHSNHREREPPIGVQASIRSGMVVCIHSLR